MANREPGAAWQRAYPRHGDSGGNSVSTQQSGSGYERALGHRLPHPREIFNSMPISHGRRKRPLSRMECQSPKKLDVMIALAEYRLALQPASAPGNRLLSPGPKRCSIESALRGRLGPGAGVEIFHEIMPGRTGSRLTRSWLARRTPGSGCPVRHCRLAPTGGSGRPTYCPAVYPRPRCIRSCICQANPGWN